MVFRHLGEDRGDSGGGLGLYGPEAKRSSAFIDGSGGPTRPPIAGRLDFIAPVPRV